MLTLTSSQRNDLSRQAHALKPVIYIGKAGLTGEVLKATDQALEDHELIKIKFTELIKNRKNTITLEMEKALEATRVRIIGNITILYRKKKKM